MARNECGKNLQRNFRPLRQCSANLRTNKSERDSLLQEHLIYNKSGNLQW